MTFELKLFLYFYGKLFDFKKTSFRCHGFTVAIYVFLEAVGKGVYITRMGTSRNYGTYSTIHC